MLRDKITTKSDGKVLTIRFQAVNLTVSNKNNVLPTLTIGH